MEPTFLQAVVLPKPSTDPILTYSVVGEDWLHDRLQKAEEPVSVRQGFTPTTIGLIEQKLAHPLVSEIRHIRGGRRDAALRFDVMELCLSQLMALVDVDSIGQRLREDSEYEKVEYELLVGAGYSRARTPLYINFGGPGPDLVGRSRAGQLFGIECKKKDSKTSLEIRMNRYRQIVEPGLIQALDARGLRYHITFTLLGDPGFIEAERFLAETLALCNSTELGTCSIADTIDVTAIKLTEEGGSVPGEIIQMLRTERSGAFKGRVMASEVPTSSEAPSFSRCDDPIQIQWSIPEDVSGRARGVANSIREAARQLPATGPSIVYLDINARDWDSADRSLRELAQEVTRLMEGSFRRINHVILTAIFESKSRDGYESLGFQACVIDQPRPRTPLAPDVQLLGRTPRFHREWIPGLWKGD